MFRFVVDAQKWPMLKIVTFQEKQKTDLICSRAAIFSFEWIIVTGMAFSKDYHTLLHYLFCFQRENTLFLT